MAIRLDSALVARGIARSRGQAVDLIKAGVVLVNGRPAHKPALAVGDTDHIEAPRDHYVSRAAHKLLGAVEASGVQLNGRALDAGASTGGFTQVLLEHGCEPVYAVDVGIDQLAPQLREDPRVIVHEHLNLRDLTLAHLDHTAVDVIVGDVSFISLRLLLEPLLAVLNPHGVALLLVKPQFEVGRGGLDAHGVVTDSVARQQAVNDVVADADRLGWTCTWQGESVMPGQNGNVEFFILLEHESRAEASAIRSDS